MNGSSSHQPAHTNRLAGETSPYLLQHAHNPVDWYPWGEEAFEKARREDKPVLLSVGYAACHWCHVMEHESFENDEIARVMNENFVCVKVDREERPDIDEIYMNVVQAMTGHGGWPMTVFLTPEGKPFYGGTYFPPVDRYNMPGFPRLLEHLARAYKEKRDEIDRSAQGWADSLQRASALPAAAGGRWGLAWSIVDRGVDQMSRRFDDVNGGFGGPPKFPHSMDLSLFMRAYRRSGRLELMAQVRKSLDKMAEGGIYDQIGGGFHRYSVDERWAVPHFEKMLYDNALLARTYLEAHLVTGEEGYARIARETLDYVLAEMRDPAGGFWSSQDADSEGEEGKFFVWSPEEIRAAVPAAQADLLIEHLGVTGAGNFEHGKTVLHVEKPLETIAAERGREPAGLRAELDAARRALYQAREQRVRPGTDDKVLTAWNGLMISAMAAGYRVLGDERYKEAARAAADFILTKMSAPDGKLLRTYRAGQAKLNAYLEDYGAFIEALVDLYQADFDTRWVQEARRLSSVMLEQYWDDAEGGFHFTGKDHESLLVRTKPYYDGATPSGNSLAVSALLELSRLTGDQTLADRAERTLQLFASLMAQAPEAFPNLLAALDFYLSPPVELAIVGPRAAPETRALVEVAWRRFMPSLVIACAEPGSRDLPLLEGKEKPGAYVCRNFACAAPVDTPEALTDELSRV